MENICNALKNLIINVSYLYRFMQETDVLQLSFIFRKSASPKTVAGIVNHGMRVLNRPEHRATRLAGKIRLSYSAYSTRYSPKFWAMIYLLACAGCLVTAGYARG